MLFYHCKVSNEITGSSLADIKDPQILFLSDCEASDIFTAQRANLNCNPSNFIQLQVAQRLALVELLLLEADPRRIHTVSKWAIPTHQILVQLPRFEEPSDICVALGASKPTKASDLKKRPVFNKFQLDLWKSFEWILRSFRRGCIWKHGLRGLSHPVETECEMKGKEMKGKWDEMRWNKT